VDDLRLASALSHLGLLTNPIEKLDDQMKHLTESNPHPKTAAPRKLPIRWPKEGSCVKKNQFEQDKGVIY